MTRCYVSYRPKADMLLRDQVYSSHNVSSNNLVKPRR